MSTELTIMTLILFKVAQTIMSTPGLSTIVTAIFCNSCSFDFHRMGMGIRNRYTSVETFEMNGTQMIGFDIPAWLVFPGLG